MPSQFSPERIVDRFDNACIRRLASIGKLLPGADLLRFGDGVRDAARLYAESVSRPNANRLRAEIEALYRAAAKRDFERLAGLLENISGAAREHLTKRYRRTVVPAADTVSNPDDRLVRRRAPRFARELPASTALREAAQREGAAVAVEALCRLGQQHVRGRRRPTGRRSISTETILYAPRPRRNFPRRAAEREFVMWLQVAWLDAIGKIPTLTARHEAPGPFARLVGECLALVGAPHVDPVELINRLHRWRLSGNKP